MTTSAGLILCGGRSRRMGRPKEWLPFGPERLLQRVVRLVRAAVNPVLLVAAAGQDLPELPRPVVVLRDPHEDQGPLQGIAAGLAAVPKNTDLVYITASDVPFLHPAWIRHLSDLATDHDLVIPEVGGRLHPLAAIYRRGPTLAAAEALLARGERRVLDLMGQLACRTVGEAELAAVDPGLDSVRNLNTPGDYRRALADAGFDPRDGR